MPLLPNSRPTIDLHIDYQSKIRRALLGGQKVQIANENSILVDGDIHASEGTNLVIGNNNTITYSGVDVKQLLEFLHAEEQRIANDAYARALQGYLKDLNSYCDHLPYMGLYDPSFSLNKSYVPIKFTKGKQDKQNSAIFIEEVLQEKTPHILIIGEPGAGKSTILRQIAKYAWNDPEKIGLQESYLPVLLPLRIFSTLHGSLHERIRLTLEKMDMLEKPFPDRFFTVWSENEQTKWLLLLDGLDEVPAEERPNLIMALNDLVIKSNSVRAIITSRPSGYSDGELVPDQIAEYKALPFSTEQVQDFAANWFDAQALVFIRALEKINITALYETPLLLTIAARIYLKRSQNNETGSLPERRAELYAEFVKIMLDEANSRGLSDEIGKDLAEDSIHVLAYLAWEIKKNPSLDSENALAHEIAIYLKQSSNLGDDRAETRGRNFILAIGRHSGIFLKTEKTYSWLHPTFGEYLAAWYMVKKEMPQLDIDNHDLPKVYYRFVYPDWKETTLFAIEILASQGKDVTPWVNGFYKSRGAIEGGEALSSLGKADSDLASKIIGELSSLARRDWRGGKSVALLGNLCTHYPQAKDAFVNLIYEDDLVDGFVREEVIILLGKAGHADELLKLASDAQLNPYLRKDAVMALVKISEETDKAAQACLAVAQDKNLGISVQGGIAQFYQMIKIDVTKALGKLPGWDKEAATILLDIAKDEENDRSQIREIVEILTEMGHFNELKEIAQDINLDVWGRASAVKQMLKIQFLQMDHLDPLLHDLLERKERKLEDFIELIHNENADMQARFWAILKFSPYHDHSFFQIVDQSIFVAQSLADNSEVESSISNVAGEMIPIYRQVIPLAMEFIYDEEESLNARLNQIISLGRSGRTNELWDIVRNKQSNPEIRTTAAGQLVESNTSPEILWRFAREKKMVAEVRIMAVIKLFNNVWELEPENWHQMSEVLSLSKSLAKNKNLDQSLIEYIRELPDTSLKLLKLANDEELDLITRIKSAEMAAYFGYLDDSLQILLSLIHSEQIDDQILGQVIAAISRIGDSRFLPDLETIASQNQNEDLRKAASEATEKICEREKPQE